LVLQHLDTSVGSIVTLNLSSSDSLTQRLLFGVERQNTKGNVEFDRQIVEALALPEPEERRVDNDWKSSSDDVARQFMQPRIGRFTRGR